MRARAGAESRGSSERYQRPACVSALRVAFAALPALPLFLPGSAVAASGSNATGSPSRVVSRALCPLIRVVTQQPAVGDELPQMIVFVPRDPANHLCGCDGR